MAVILRQNTLFRIWRSRCYISYPFPDLVKACNKQPPPPRPVLSVLSSSFCSRTQLSWTLHSCISSVTCSFWYSMASPGRETVQIFLSSFVASASSAVSNRNSLGLLLWRYRFSNAAVHVGLDASRPKALQRAGKELCLEIFVGDFNFPITSVVRADDFNPPIRSVVRGNQQLSQSYHVTERINTNNEHGSFL